MDDFQIYMNDIVIVFEGLKKILNTHKTSGNVLLNRVDILASCDELEILSKRMLKLFDSDNSSYFTLELIIKNVVNMKSCIERKDTEIDINYTDIDTYVREIENSLKSISSSHQAGGVEKSSKSIKKAEDPGVQTSQDMILLLKRVVEFLDNIP